MQNAESFIVVLDGLVAKLRVEQDVRLAEVLHHQLHSVAWVTRAEQFDELKKSLRHTVQSGVSRHSVALTLHIEQTLAAMERGST